MSDKTYNLYCGDNCAFEGMTKEQILAAFAEITGKIPSGFDDPFVTKIKDIATGGFLQFATRTQAEYNALVEAGMVQPNTLYLITDESESADLTEIYASLASLNAAVESINVYERVIANALSCDTSNPKAEINTKRWKITPDTAAKPNVTDFFGVREPLIINGEVVVATMIETSPVPGRVWQNRRVGGSWQGTKVIYTPKVTFSNETISEFSAFIDLEGTGAGYYNRFAFRLQADGLALLAIGDRKPAEGTSSHTAGCIAEALYVSGSTSAFLASVNFQIKQVDSRWGVNISNVRMTKIENGTLSAVSGVKVTEIIGLA